MSNENKILHLTLHRRWFDMILSGEKKEEYREIKMYWAVRLCLKVPVPWGGYLSKADHICDPERREAAMNDGFMPTWEDYDVVRFTNGYAKNAPSFDIECKGIGISRGKTEWGAPADTDVFIISLGNVIEKRNI